MPLRECLSRFSGRGRSGRDMLSHMSLGLRMLAVFLCVYEPPGKTGYPWRTHFFMSDEIGWTRIGIQCMYMYMHVVVCVYVCVR